MTRTAYKVVVRGRIRLALGNASAGPLGFDQGPKHLVGLVPDQKVLHGLFHLTIELVPVNLVRENEMTWTYAIEEFACTGSRPRPPRHSNLLDDGEHAFLGIERSWRRRRWWA